MAAAGWNRGPGAGSMDAVDRDAVFTSSLQALNDLAVAIPGFLNQLQSKEQLEARQRALAQSGGSIEQTGTAGERVQLRLGERVGQGTFCVVFRGELLSRDPSSSRSTPVAAKFVSADVHLSMVLSLFVLTPFQELRKTDSTQLRNEFRMYKKMGKCSTCSLSLRSVFCVLCLEPNLY